MLEKIKKIFKKKVEKKSLSPMEEAIQKRRAELENSAIEELKALKEEYLKAVRSSTKPEEFQEIKLCFVDGSVEAGEHKKIQIPRNVEKKQVIELFEALGYEEKLPQESFIYEPLETKRIVEMSLR